jgi:phospholipase/carboxylesterase
MGNLEKRPGERPLTSYEGPHSQLSDQSSAELWSALIQRCLKLPHIIKGISSVSPKTSVALLFDDIMKIINPASSLSPNDPLEPVHIHGAHDTSLHMCLPIARAKAVCELGWGEEHQFADHGTEIMVYGPRNEQELEIVLRLVQESLQFAR